MKAATKVHLARFRMLRHATAALILAGLAPWQASAVNPPAAPDDAMPSPTAVEIDPYRAFLESLDSRTIACRERSVELRVLLDWREMLARQFAESTADARIPIAREMDRIDQQIEVVESALEASVAASAPGDAPNIAPAPTVDLKRMQTLAWRTRRPVYLPVPRAPVLPALPAPPREALYLDYLAARTGDSAFAQGLVADIGRMFQQRREFAYRHDSARAHERVALEAAISAVSQRIRATSSTATDAAVISRK